jgi:hypothetical protein
MPRARARRHRARPRIRPRAHERGAQAADHADARELVAGRRVAKGDLAAMRRTLEEREREEKLRNKRIVARRNRDKWYIRANDRSRR